MQTLMDRRIVPTHLSFAYEQGSQARAEYIPHEYIVCGKCRILCFSVIHSQNIHYNCSKTYCTIHSYSRELSTSGTGTVAITDDAMITPASLDIGKKQFTVQRRTKETQVNIPATADIVRWTELPQSIEEVTDDILQKVIVCGKTGRPYRIVAQELAFYRAVGLPLPREHPDVRHAARVANIPPRSLQLRSCDQSEKEILSIYPQDVGCKVVDNELYGKIVYG